MTFQLQVVPATHIDFAWSDGASKLEMACLLSAGEITADQLKMSLSKGEWTLLAGVRDDMPVAWAAVAPLQYPNKRVLWVQAIYAPGSTSIECFEELKKYARMQGCSAVRGACNDTIQRLWEAKYDAKKLYSVVDIPIGV